MSRKQNTFTKGATLLRVKYTIMSNKSQAIEWKYSNATIQNNVIDVVRTSFKPACHIKKVSKTEYMTGKYLPSGEFVSDGEVYEVTAKQEGQPMRNRRSLRQIFRTLRQLIAANYTGGNSELFVTLTYADQHNDPKRLHEDIVLFWKRLKYRYPALKYIAIVEPHASGNFHIHMLLANTNGEELYIPDAEMRKMWGQGITTTERLDDIDHMGAYFVAYFTNMELTPDEIKVYAEQDDVEYKNGKAYIKGRRLDFYPENMRIYRHSSNCDKPERRTGSEVDELLQNAKQTYSHETTFEQDGNEYRILTEQYRRGRTNEA